MDLLQPRNCGAAFETRTILNAAKGQLAIQDLSFPEERTLASFMRNGNEETLQRLADLVSGTREFRLMWLAGAAGSGKSHLAEALGRAAGVWPQCCFARDDWMDQSREHSYASLRFLVVEDIESLLGDCKSEQWLAFVIDERKRMRLPTLFTAEVSPAHCECALNDLRTRFALAEVLPILALPDEIKLDVMSAFAKMKGFNLDRDVLNYLLRRHNRNLGRLIELIREIDRRSLSAKRPVTVPLVRDLLQSA